jgi:hypothetical protein
MSHNIVVWVVLGVGNVTSGGGDRKHSPSGCLVVGVLNDPLYTRYEPSIWLFFSISWIFLATPSSQLLYFCVLL